MLFIWEIFASFFLMFFVFSLRESQQNNDISAKVNSLQKLKQFDCDISLIKLCAICGSQIRMKTKWIEKKFERQWSAGQRHNAGGQPVCRQSVQSPTGRANPSRTSTKFQKIGKMNQACQHEQNRCFNDSLWKFTKVLKSTS